MNDKILPITDAIKGYIQKERLEEEKNAFIKSIIETSYDEEEYNIIEEQRKKEIAYFTLKKLNIEARKNNKNKIWIYEQMVLLGYGYEIDYYSSLYQEMLEIYKNMYQINKKIKIN